MYIPSGAYMAARNEVFLLKACEILSAEGDAAGERAARSAYARAIAGHDKAYSKITMDWARVGNSTTENLR